MNQGQSEREEFAVPNLPKDEKAPTKKEDTATDWFYLIQFAVLVALLLYFFNVGYVVRNSMEPTLKPDTLVLYKNTQDIPRQTIASFHFPYNPKVIYIKRVIGRGGDTVVIKKKSIWVNGKKLHEPYAVGENPFPQTVKVPPNTYFVLGDNRENSLDSIDFGPISVSSVKGKFICKLLPFW